MIITETTTVADIAATVPQSVRVFQRHGIDFCCGGKTPLAVACQEQGVALAVVVDAIDASVHEQGAEQDWSSEPLHLLIDHIVATYHDRLREDLPRLESMSGRVTLVHGGKAAHFARLEAIVTELSAELLSHMRKEEMVLFPAIRRIESRQGRPAVAISSPIAVMEAEHDHAGALLSELRAITGDYAAPIWACETVRALYFGLSELEAAMHTHVHLENNILFPRALALSATAG